MQEFKKTYIVDENNDKVAVQLDIETFNRIEEILENYALFQLMNANGSDEVLNQTDAVVHYESLEKAD